MSFTPEHQEPTLCSDCQDIPPKLDACWAAMSYTWPWTQLVGQFKFQNDPAWAKALALLMRSAPGVEDALDQAEVLLPMPLSAQRLAERGFNQALLLATALCTPKTQALTLLNDLTMMEASKTLATQMLQQAPDEAARLSFLYAHVLSRQPKEQEVTVLKRELSNALTHYRAHPDDAASYLSAPAQSAALSDLAAYTVVASLVLNLDEAITHE